MSRVILNLPGDLRITQLDAALMALANANGCKISQSVDAFGNRSYSLEPIYTKPEARNVVPLRRVPPMFPAPTSPGAAA